MRRPLLKDAIEFLQSSGAQDIKPYHGGKHIKVRFLFKEQNLSLVVSVSPSDWRAGRNQKSFMKRMLRDATARHEARLSREPRIMLDTVKRLIYRDVTPPKASRF